MAELIYHVATTTDGFIADPQGKADGSVFLYEGDHIPDFLNHIKEYAAVLMGRKTYEFGYQFGMKPGEAGYKGIKHYVFSKNIGFDSNEEVEVVQTDAVAFTKQLKTTLGNTKIWLCGGAELANSLLEAQLIDTLILKINPVLIGQGIPLFSQSSKQVKLQLLDLKKYENGVLLPTYKIEYT